MHRLPFYESDEVLIYIYKYIYTLYEVLLTMTTFDRTFYDLSCRHT